MARAGTGHIELLPSGSYRVHVYGGIDPLTGRAIRHRQTVKTPQQARIVLGRLLEQAADGRRPDSRVTVADVLARYMAVAELEPSTRETYGGYIRRTILPALGKVELRKVRGPVLDTFYARLRRCGDLACTGRPFTEHKSFPGVVIEPGGSHSAWRQAAAAIREAVASDQMAPGQQLPSVRELAAQHALPVSALRRALEELATEGVIAARQGRRAVVAGVPVPVPRPRAGDTGHDCARAGCQPHRCRPMSGMTIRQIHAILSGAFAAAVRWEWIERNPAGAAKLPKAPHRSPSSPTPATVAAVIAAARDQELDLLALYLWLAYSVFRAFFNPVSTDRVPVQVGAKPHLVVHEIGGGIHAEAVNNEVTVDDVDRDKVSHPVLPHQPFGVAMVAGAGRAAGDRARRCCGDQDPGSRRPDGQRGPQGSLSAFEHAWSPLYYPLWQSSV